MKTLTCEICGEATLRQISTRERPFIDEMSGLGEPVHVVGIETEICKQHGPQGNTYTAMGQYLDIIAYEIARKEFPAIRKRTRQHFLLRRLMSAIEDAHPWLRRMYDPADNEPPPRKSWFGWWEGDALWMEYGAKLKVIQ